MGAVGALSQFWYPRITTRFAGPDAAALSSDVAQHLCGLVVAVTVPAAVGIVTAPWLIELFYSTFVGAEGALRLLLVAVPNLVVASWLMPLTLSIAPRPWIEGLLIYPFSLGVLVLATYWGHETGGIAGAAYGLVAGSVPLVVLQLARLRATGLLTGRDTLTIGLVSIAASLFLGLLVR